MTLEGFVVHGGRGAHTGRHREHAGIALDRDSGRGNGGGGRRERRVKGSKKIPEENGVSAADDSASIWSHQQL